VLLLRGKNKMNLCRTYSSVPLLVTAEKIRLDIVISGFRRDATHRVAQNSAVLRHDIVQNKFQILYVVAYVTGVIHRQLVNRRRPALGRPGSKTETQTLLA